MNDGLLTYKRDFVEAYDHWLVIIVLIGEMEYEAMFHGPPEELSTNLFYQGSTILLFITFLGMVSIVIMNLLVRSIVLIHE